MKKIWRLNITKKQFLIFAAAAVVFRLLLTALQRASLAPEISMLDDLLMYNGAVSITNGEWLGPYTYMTLGKHMLFSVWLAFVHWSGISYILAGNILSVVCCIVTIGALSPVIKNNLHRLIFLCVLMFCPALYADYTLRVYRDNITTSVFLLVFACVAGIALRWKSEKTAALWTYGIGGGLALGASYLLREDGYWLLPFAVVGCIISAIYILREKTEKKLQKLIVMGSMFAVMALCITAYCGMNYKYYGRFIISDFTSSDFQDAYGALTRIDTGNDGSMIVPVDYEARQKMYKASPAFAELMPYLEDEQTMLWWRKDVGGGVVEFSGGGFYWAVRNAASLAGYYETPKKAQAYYERLAAELNEAYDNGNLHAATGRRSALNTPITGRYILPTLQEVGSSFVTVAIYKDIDCSPPLSVGSRDLIFEMSDYLNCNAMITTTDYAPDSRIQLWAVSRDAPVDIALYTADGTEISADVVPTTGGDVYSMFLRGGISLRYPDRARSTATFIPVDGDVVIRLTSDGKVVEIPASEMDEYAEQNGIYYKVEYVGGDYTEITAHGTAELWLYRGMRVVTLIYSMLSPLVLLVAIFFFAKTVIINFKSRKTQKQPENGLALWITAGIALSALLRLGMVAFAETSAFGIGTNPMYLSAVYPLGIVFSFMCFFIGRRNAAAV